MVTGTAEIGEQLDRRDKKGKFRYSKFLRVWNYYVKEPHLMVNIWD